MGGVACQAVIDEFCRAAREVKTNPSTLGLWQSIIGQYHPTFLTECENSVAWSKSLARQWLAEVNPDIDMAKIEKTFLSHSSSFSHNRHIDMAGCKDAGLNIVELEADQDLQDAVLSLHHTMMLLFSNFCISKIVSNHMGEDKIEIYQPQ